MTWGLQAHSSWWTDRGLSLGPTTAVVGFRLHCVIGLFGFRHDVAPLAAQHLHGVVDAGIQLALRDLSVVGVAELLQTVTVVGHSKRVATLAACDGSHHRAGS